MGNLEEMYSRPRLEEEDEGGVVVGAHEVIAQTNTYVLVGKFLTDKHKNFQAMQNVLASIWRPREGVEIHDLGGQRYSFVFFHVLDLQKVLEGGPWTFEQSLLVYKKLEACESSHQVNLETVDIWVQVYDLPTGMVSEKILHSIGNHIGLFIKMDPINSSGTWRLYTRIRIKMEINKPLKRRMKIKKEGGTWSWVNFKYERLSTFCFICGLLGHSERDCMVDYANPDRPIKKVYGTWLRAPMKNMRNQNRGARWLKNGADGGQSWTTRAETSNLPGEDHGGDTVIARFMEVDGHIGEISGDKYVIRYVSRDLGSKSRDGTALNTEEKLQGRSEFECEAIVLD